VSLHGQTGQKDDIAEYIKSIVHSGEDSIMKLWGPEDKDLVIQTLSARANGMYSAGQLKSTKFLAPEPIDF
jgi:hypothetical protein